MLELWLQPVDEASVRWANGQSPILDDHETTRWQRYRSRESQDLFVVAHVATRHILSHYASRPPESWRFDRGANGRPEIIDGPSDIRFNISHTEGTGGEGMVAVLVHDDADCGVDVEHVARPMDIASVARRVFTPDEQAAIFAQPPESQADRFYQLWTLKEAFIKAKGKGLAMPLQQFGFTIEGRAIEDRVVEGRAIEGGSATDGSNIKFDCDPAIDPAPNDWWFATVRPPSGHLVSVAAHRHPADTEIAFRHLTI